jgi:FixJ family two-component response regulator
MQAGDPAHTERIDQELCAAVVGIIDDDDDVRASLNRLIRADGHWTMLFGSAQEFLASGLVDIPHCLVVDYHMPGMNGLDLIQALERMNQAVPVVILTADTDRLPSKPAQIVYARLHGAPQTGAVAVISKPLAPVLLVDVLRSILPKPPCSRVEER